MTNVNKIDALNTTVDIITGPSFTVFQETDIPVATPFNYLEKGYKRAYTLPDSKPHLTKEYYLPENIEVQLSWIGHYINFDMHTFTVNNDGNFMLLRLFDKNLTPMIFNAYGDNEHIDIALNKHFGLLASWHETSLVPSKENENMGNLVYYVIIKLEAIEKMKQAEEIKENNKR